MAKNDHAHAVRLVKSIEQNAGNSEAKAFEEKLPLSKSASVDKKYDWARNACAYLEERFDTETIIRIRKACRCNDGKTIADKMLKYLRKAESIRQFVDDFNAHETFVTLEYVSENKILLCYPQCYCACIKRAPGQISKSWCYCTLGNAEGIFKEVFKRDDIEVVLLKSIKTGAEQCVIEVTF